MILSLSVLSFFFSNLIVETPFANEHIVVLFFFGVIIGPFLETMLFQALPFKITIRFFKHKYKLFIYLFFSAGAFMLVHPLNIAYMVFSFSAGFVCALFYYIATFKKESAVLLVFLIHMSYNLVVFVLHAISKYFV